VEWGTLKAGGKVQSAGVAGKGGNLRGGRVTGGLEKGTVVEQRSRETSLIQKRFLKK